MVQKGLHKCVCKEISMYINLVMNVPIVWTMSAGNAWTNSTAPDRKRMAGNLRTGAHRADVDRQPVFLTTGIRDESFGLNYWPRFNFQIHLYVLELQIY